jgi:hypothetical protein
MHLHLQNACLEFKDRSARLTLLNLNGRGIGSTGMKRLAESICNPRPATVIARQRPYRSPLVCLWLENNYLHPSSAEDLSRLVALSPSLRYLHLAHNSLGNQGAKIVCESSFTQLQVCNLTDNEIGPAGARSIAEKLKDPKCIIQTLILDSNQLRDEGTLEIAEALKFNTSLKSLDLRYNHLTRRGLLAIREVLFQRGNMTLHTLHLQEEEDEDCLPLLPQKQNPQSTIKYSQRAHCCDRCRIKSDVDFFLALNQAGRHSFSNLELSTALWSRILAKTSQDDPSLLHAALLERPDIACASTPTSS